MLGHPFTGHLRMIQSNLKPSVARNPPQSPLGNRGTKESSRYDWGARVLDIPEKRESALQLVVIH